MDFIVGLPKSKGYEDCGETPWVSSKYSYGQGQNFSEFVLEVLNGVEWDYHPQTKVVNRGSEQYLRAMVFDRPQHWFSLLAWAENCYNTSYNSSIKMTPYQALYGKLPPTILPCVSGSSNITSLDEMLVDRDALIRKFKKNLEVSKARVELQANRKRRELEFVVGDLVLLKRASAL